MIIDLTKSQMFIQDPDTRFVKEYGIAAGAWKEVWRRYKLLDYTEDDLIDFLFIKHARRLPKKSIKRWITKTEIYERAHMVLTQGATHANSSIFGEYEQYIIDELTKQLRWGGTTNSRSII